MSDLLKPWPTQIAGATECLRLLKVHRIAYMAWEERTGKSLTAILASRGYTDSRKLIVTKKKALQGWEDTLNGVSNPNDFDLINYHSVGKAQGRYGLGILDEAHAYISGYPKRSVMWKEVHKKVYGLPLIYSSATPYAQGPQLLYNQFALSKWSPWASFKDFYAWYKEYAQRDASGSFQMVYFGQGNAAVDYTAVDAKKIIASVEHVFMTMRRDFEHEPEDVLHYVELSDRTRKVYNIIADTRVLNFDHADSGKEYLLICDSPMKYRSALHMLEGGGLKIENDYVVLGNCEKAEYILRTWGDTEDLVIMYQYIVEGIKLKQIFRRARLLQGTSYAEGVDLSMHRHLVVYSQDFSTAKHTQRRARQANRERKEEIKVHFLLVKGAASEKMYRDVSVNKRNFVDTVFERI